MVELALYKKNKPKRNKTEIMIIFLTLQILLMYAISVKINSPTMIPNIALEEVDNSNAKNIIKNIIRSKM